MKKIVLSKRFLAMLLVMLMAGQMLMPSLALAEGEWVSEVSDQIQTAKYYGVQFVVDGTDFTKLNVEAGFTLKTLPEAPAKEGYIFLGWMGEDGIPFSTKTVVNGDMRITARYAVQESMPESSLFTFEDRGDYTSVAFEGTYMNEAPTVRRIDGFAVEDGEITYRVLEAWGMRGLKEATAGNVQTMLDAWGVENQGTGFIARLTITALPEADTTQSYSVFSMNGNQLGDVIARNVVVGDVVELPLTYDLDNGIALVEISDDALIAYSQKTVWSNEEVYLTGWLPEGAVVEAKPVNGVEIDGREALVAYDIKIYASEERRAQGKIWQPADKKIKVHFFNKDFAGQTLEVYHIPETKSAEPELVETIENAKSDWVSFDAGHFSVYAVVEGVTPEARMTVNFCDKDGDIIATMYVKNSDDADAVETILFDPGAGTLDDNEIFRGWVVGEVNGDIPTYTVEMATADGTPDLLTIEEIRAWAAAFEVGGENQITEGDVVNIRAAIYKNYVVTYYDSKDIAQSADSVLIMPDDASAYYEYTISQSYTPVKDTVKFNGWEVTDATEAHITTDTQQEHNLYQKDDVIHITGNVDFKVNQSEGHWIVFHENGKGGTYKAPQFVERGDNTQDPGEMTRKGYTFGGWYTEVTGAADEHSYQQVVESSRFTFGNNLDDFGDGKLHLYAKWTPVTTAPYTVIMWGEMIGDDGKVADGQYEVLGSYVNNNGTVGQNIPYTSVDNGDEDYATGVGTNNGHYTGFNLTEASKNQQVIITPEGDAVLNLYYDRILYNFKFYLYRNGTQNNRYDYANNSGNGRNLDDVVTWHSNQTQHPDVTDASGYTVQSETVGGRTYHYFVMQAYYGEDISGDWPTYDKLTGANGRVPVSYVMMVGTKLKPNPTNQGDGTVKGIVSVMNENILGATNNSNGNYVVIRYPDSYYNWRYHIWYETIPGEDYTGKTTHVWNGVTYYEDTVLTVRSSNTTVTNQNAPKYQGFDFIDWRGQNWNNRNYWTTTEGGTTLYHINEVYSRQQFTITYFDGNYVDGNGGTIQNRAGQQLHESPEIPQGAVIPDEYRTYVPEAQEPGYIFKGWYLDEGCTVPYPWGTMPVGPENHSSAITVYAKWQQIQYRVYLQSNVPEDEEFTWGSDSQATCFRVTYGDTVSLPVGRDREGWEFLGWYTTPNFEPSSRFTEDYALTEANVTLDYDQDTEYTDTYDKWGNLNNPKKNTDKEGNRDWITKKLILYAKWHEVLEGAEGINIVYDPILAGEGVEPPTGSNPPVDNTYYIDTAMATAGAGSTADDPDEYQFECWVVQKWNGTAFEDTDVEVYPGDTFEVLKANAREEDYTDPDNPQITKKYTVQLRAFYKPLEDPTPTHIWWFPNYPGITQPDNIPEKENTISDSNPAEKTENMAINQAVDIMSATKYAYEGFTFLGWAKVGVGTTLSMAEGNTTNAGVPQPNLTANDLFLKWENNKYYAKDKNGNWVEVESVAADEDEPYDDLYAVWEGPTQVPVEKIWQSGNFAENQPDSVTVELLRDGESFSPKKTAVLSADENDETKNWKYTFTDLPTRNANNQLITYTIVETVPEGWSASYQPATGGVTATMDGTATQPLKVTNTPYNGKITLKKNIAGTTEDFSSLFANLTFTVKGPKQTDNTYKNTYTFTLSQFTPPTGSSFTGLYTLEAESLAFVEPGEYIYYEGNADLLKDWGYSLDTTNAGTTGTTNPVTITLSEGGQVEGTITNRYTRDTGNLVINKTVTGDHATGVWPYKVKIKNSKDWWLKQDLTLSSNESEAGVFEIPRTGETLGGTLSLNNVPTGTYTVIEQGTEEGGAAQIENYELEVTYNPTTATATVPKDGTGTVGITNNYTKQVGTLSVSKVTSPNTISQAFKFTVKNSDGKYLYKDSTNKYGFQTDAFEFEATSNGAAVLFVDIPVDTYTVTEVIDGETAGDQANVQVTGYRYDGTTYSPTTGSIKVEKTHTQANPATVTITNSYTELINVTVEKTVDGADNGDTFTITATVTENGAAVTTLPEQPTQTNGVTVEDNGNGTLTITLTGGKSATLKLPEGAKLVVAETPNALYTTTYEASDTIAAVKDGDKITVTNTRKEGSLTVTKTVSGDAANDVEFEFTVTLSEALVAGYELPTTPEVSIDSTRKVLTFKLKGGESVDLTKLPVGATYTVAETANANYTTEKTGDSGSITTEGATAAFTNTRVEASVTIKKTVSGNMGDTKKDFDFTVTLSEALVAGYELPTTPEVSIDSTRKVLTFKLKHNGEVTLPNLPVGATLTVEEANYSTDGYTTTVDEAEGRSKEITIAENNELITFENHKETTPDTGVKLDFLPYVTILGIAGLGLIAMMIKRRRKVSR